MSYTCFSSHVPTMKRDLKVILRLQKVSCTECQSLLISEICSAQSHWNMHKLWEYIFVCFWTSTKSLQSLQSYLFMSFYGQADCKGWRPAPPWQSAFRDFFCCPLNLELWWHVFWNGFYTPFLPNYKDHPSCKGKGQVGLRPKSTCFLGQKSLLAGKTPHPPLMAKVLKNYESCQSRILPYFPMCVSVSQAWHLKFSQ